MPHNDPSTNIHGFPAPVPHRAFVYQAAGWQPSFGLDRGRHPVAPDRWMPQPIDGRLLQVQDASNIKTPPAGGVPHSSLGVHVYELLQSNGPWAKICLNEEGQPVLSQQNDERRNSKISQWRFEPLEYGWIIRSMSSEKYLAIDIRKDPASIVASDFPVAWDMRYDHRDIAFRISWPNSKLCLSPSNNPNGPPLHLSSEDAGWQLRLVATLPPSNQDSGMPAAPPENGYIPPADDSSSDDDTHGPYTIVKTTSKKKKVSSGQPEESDSDDETVLKIAKITQIRPGGAQSRFTDFPVPYCTSNVFEN